MAIFGDFKAGFNLGGNPNDHGRCRGHSDLTKGITFGSPGFRIDQVIQASLKLRIKLQAGQMPPDGSFSLPDYWTLDNWEAARIASLFASGRTITSPAQTIQLAVSWYAKRRAVWWNHLREAMTHALELYYRHEKDRRNSTAMHASDKAGRQTKRRN